MVDCARTVRSLAASMLASIAEFGSNPASGSMTIGMPSAAMARPPTVLEKGAIVSGRKPRTWRLPRAVISMMPLPRVLAAVQTAANASSAMALPQGTRRARSPSPVAIGWWGPGQAFGRWGAVVDAVLGAIMDAPPQRAQRDRRRCRCAADATVRAVAPPQAARRLREPHPDFPRVETRARVGRPRRRR